MTRKELIEQIREKQSFLCVGLDTDLDKMPKGLKEIVKKEYEEEEMTFGMLFEFSTRIIDATAPYCVAYKPNLAFYEAYGIEGMAAFEGIIEYLQENYPKHLIIADAKRGDIGNTSKMYAKTFFEQYNVDALTVAPYMGEANKGSQDFQLMKDENGERLFEKVLKKSQEWGNDENMMYVVGATQGKMFEDIRKLAPNHFLLVPGVGAQGGSLEEVCKYGMIDDCGLLVNSSRGIIYASSEKDFAEVAGQKAKELQEQMAKILADASIC